jgi:chromate transporter
LRELAAVFLKLGTISFGGPAAHIAMMEHEVVRRRGWVTHEQFLDLLSASNLIPGPNSTELAIHVGRMRAGTRGLVVAGACFILPAALIVSALAALYLRYGALPETTAVLYGVKPVVIAIVVVALWRLARTAMKSWMLGVIAAAAIVASAVGANEILLLAAAGLLAALIQRLRRPPRATSAARDEAEPARTVPTLVPIGGVASVIAGAAKVGLWPLFLYFTKVGSVLFGSGYVLLAFLRAGLVERNGWLTETQLLDAVAVGQVTPGPVFTTATFVGYLLAGGAGAAVATAGIFLPAFVFVAASAPLVSRLRRSSVAGAALDGINAASLALMTVVSFHLARAALMDVPTISVGALSLLVLIDGRINSAWLIGAGALVGLVLR